MRSDEARDPTWMMIHELKTAPPWFELIFLGYKTAELRKRDRPFQQGDILKLREWLPDHERYSGAEMLAVITHVLTDEDGPWLMTGYCMLSFKIMNRKP